MTSITSNSTSIPHTAPTTNLTATNHPAHSRTTSLSSGQTSSQAAVTASAPAQRNVSYARVAQPTIAHTTTKPPVIAATPSSTVIGGAPAQNVRPSSTAPPPVNGNISAAVANPGAGIANGAPPNYVAQHSRRSSTASGVRGPVMPNGNRPNISFGTLNEPGTGPSSGPAVAANNPSLTAPVASNPRANSPQPPTSAGSQPIASGGAPPQAPATSSRGNIQFGDAIQNHGRVPMTAPPQAPGSMLGHNRRESTQSTHADTSSPVAHNRGMPNGGRGRNHQYANQYPQQHYGGYGRGGGGGGGGYAGNPNPNRGNQATMTPQYSGPNPSNNYQTPRHRASPAMAHSSPSLPPVQPIPTQQLYPSYTMHPPYAIPGQMTYSMDPGFYPASYMYPLNQPFGMPQTSPRPSYQQIPPPHYNSYPTPAQPMSRTSSANVGEIYGPRPGSSMGQQPVPSHTPQPHVQPPIPAQPQFNATKRKTCKIEIKNPIDGSLVNYDNKPALTPTTIANTPVIVSSPSPAPDRTLSRDSPHSRSASRSKSEQEKRDEMKATVLQRILDKDRKQKEEDEAREKQRLEAEKAEKEAKEAKEEEARIAKELEEKKKREVEEQARKEEEERLRKEAEEVALKEEEERKKKEAEEEARLEKEKEEAAKEAARIAEEEVAARAKAEVERKARAEEEQKAKAEAKALEATLKASAPATFTISKDSESMPPPRATGKSKPPPPALNLHTATNEPGPPSAALNSLRSARFIDNLNGVSYPPNIQSPNPALNPAASGKFKYAKDFLMQFKGVFTEKPSVDWDQKMRETVGEPDSARPQTARTPGGLAPRGSSSRTAGQANIPPPMGAFQTYKPGSMAPNLMSSAQRFEQSSRPNSLPPSSMMGFPRAPGAGSGLIRNGSSTSLSGSNTPNSPRTGNRSSRGGSRKGAGAPMEKVGSGQGGMSQHTMPVVDVKPLPVTEGRWKPPSATRAAESSAAPTPSKDNRLSPDMVQRKVKAALNKMTPEKFDKISDQILEITSQSKYETDGLTLRQVIQLTFEKATDEAAWSSMYAKFCKRMLDTMDPSIKDENVTDKSGNLVTGGNLFRKYLLNRCQEEFERGWKVNLPSKPEGVMDEAAMLSDEYYIAAAAKRRGLGLVQFIGELFKLGMLTERIMNECVRKLIDFDGGVPEDETVESLVKLLRTIGSALDASEKSKEAMNMYFRRIEKLMENKDLNSRMRFMLMDVTDLRRKGWEMKEADKGPKTIQEVREDAIKAQQEKEAASRANQRSRPGGGRGDTRSFSSGQYGGGSMHHSGWDGNSKVSAGDLEKLNNRAKTFSRTLGPSSMFNRTGSSGRRGLAPQTSRGDDSHSSSRTTTPAPSTSSKNPYSLLEESHHNDSGDINDTTSPPASIASSPPSVNAQIRSPLMMEGGSK